MFPNSVPRAHDNEPDQEHDLNGAKAIKTTFTESLDKGISADGAIHVLFVSLGSRWSVAIRRLALNASRWVSRHPSLNGCVQCFEPLASDRRYGACLLTKKSGLYRDPRQAMDIIAFRYER